MTDESPARTVEEVLRREGPIKVLTHWVTEDHERHGQSIRAGERVLLILHPANHDPSMFPALDVLDVAWPDQPAHVGFGHGAHFCIGAQLARSQARVALPRVLSTSSPICDWPAQ